MSKALERPERLDSIIRPQPGAVVSRMLLKKPTGSVTLFAFDESEGLSEHTTPFDALLVAISGRAIIRIADARHDVQAGEAISLPANIPHAVEPTEAFQMLLVMLKDAA